MILVDITHTVKASESNGRTLFRDLDTGEAIWEERRTVPRDENTVWPLPMTRPEEVIAAEKEPEPAPKKGKK